MPRRVVVLFDGSPAASAALEHGLSLAQGAGIGLIGLHAVEPPRTSVGLDAGLGLDPGAPTLGAATLSMQQVTQRRAEGQRALRLLAERAASAGVRADTLMGEGPLLDVVRHELRPDDLVAIGHAGRFARGGVGSTTRAFILHAPCPVLVARPPAVAVKRIIAAFDGVPASRAALRTADELSRQTGLPLMVIALEGRGGVGDDLESQARLTLSPSAAMSAPIVHVQAGRRIEEALLIEHMAGKDQTALLVMGAYADSALVDLFFGSITGHVLNHVTGPVVLVHG